MNGPVPEVAVFFRSHMDIVRPAAGHEISPDSHGDVRVRILHFRAHKAHPGTPSPSATRSRFSTIRRRRLKKMFPPFMRAFDLMIWLKWALSELHLRVSGFRFSIDVMITSCTEVSDKNAIREDSTVPSEVRAI
jgi:hypothetical protein